MPVRIDTPFSVLIDDVEEDINKKINRAMLVCYNAVIASSPVDTGRYKQSHHFSKNTFSSAESGAVAVTVDIKTDNFIVLQNNLPYAGVIEHGGYPNPVKRGTWRKDKKMFEVRSMGGYSYQAPKGVYAIGFQALLVALERNHIA